MAGGAGAGGRVRATRRVRAASRWQQLYARVDNVFDRRYETYAAVAEDLFPGGELARPHVAPVEKVRRVSSHRVPPAASWGCVCAGER